jgi:hypothetical protein
MVPWIEGRFEGSILSIENFDRDHRKNPFVDVFDSGNSRIQPTASRSVASSSREYVQPIPSADIDPPGLQLEGRDAMKAPAKKAAAKPAAKPAAKAAAKPAAKAAAKPAAKAAAKKAPAKKK